MANDQLKEQFATIAAESFRAVYPEAYSEAGDTEVFTGEFILNSLEKPKDPTKGRFTLPVFRFARLLKAKPPDIASAISDKVNKLIPDGTGMSCSSIAGFINVSVDAAAESAATLGAVLEQGKEYGSSTLGEGKKVLVEYSSANIAKTFGIGHLRSTVLGHSLKRIFRKLGYDVVGINYLGDWGTQFGKMIVAFRLWGDESKLSGGSGESAREDVRYLLDLYVKFHKEAETDPDLDKQAREAFKQLEQGDPDATVLWERFKEISLADFDRLFNILGVDFDLITGEAFLNDKMEPVIERFEKAGLTSISDGALIVDLQDPQLPPCLLKKADGATLYATRDLAGLIYRWEHFQFHESLYVVATSQSDHFRQAFKAIEMLEDAEDLPPERRMTGRVKHINFGWVMFGGKIMATRAGTIIFLEDVLDEAQSLAKKMIEEKNPDLKDVDETARKIGVGAVIFSQMSVRKHKDVNFDWDEVLSFEGETGPYLQYTHARLNSLLRNYDGTIGNAIDHKLLDREQERRVIEQLSDFTDAVERAAREYDPNVIAAYLLRLAGAFNKFYQRKTEDGKIDKIISDNQELTRARLALVKSVKTVIAEGLYLLGIEAPEEM